MSRTSGWLVGVWMRGVLLGVGVLVVCLAGLGSAAGGRAVSSKLGMTSLQGISFGDVWCASITRCVAVGGVSSAPTYNSEPIAARWNGISWSAQRVRVPAGITDAVLSGVSCTSSVSCMAVGWINKPFTREKTLAERWNGTRWSMLRTRALPPHSTPQLNSVSCPTSAMCMAVGTYGVYRQRMLAERWNGRRWFVQSNLAGLPFGPPAVSCPKPDLCVVADGSKALRWNGRGWSTQALPIPKRLRGVEITAVTCPTRHRCTAVGQDGSGTSAVAESWDGQQWSGRAIPTPTRFQFQRTGTYPYLTDVSCPARSRCIAVGNYATDDYGDLTLPLVATWNGGRWSLRSVHVPHHPYDASLDGLSCPSASDCTAVGGDVTSLGSSNNPLVSTWNGTTWSTTIP